MASNDFKKQLAASKGNWKAAQKKVTETRGKAGAPEFEDGIYLAKLASAELGEWNEKLKVLFKWKFMDGEYEGQVIHDYQGINSEENLYYLGRRLEDFGYEMPDDPTELPETLAAIVGEKKLCKIRLRTKGDWQNVYLQKVLEDADDAEVEDDEAEETEAEETPAAKPAKGKKAKPEPEPVEEDEAEEEEADDEAEEEEADEEETEEGDEELTIGMKVIAETANGEKKGTVIEILEKEGMARVKTEEGKVLRLAIQKLSFDEAPDDEEEEEEAPAPPAKKKAAPAPVAPPKKKR